MMVSLDCSASPQGPLPPSLHPGKFENVLKKKLSPNQDTFQEGFEQRLKDANAAGTRPLVVWQMMATSARDRVRLTRDALRTFPDSTDN